MATAKGVKLRESVFPLRDGAGCKDTRYSPQA